MSTWNPKQVVTIGLMPACRHQSSSLRAPPLPQFHPNNPMTVYSICSTDTLSSFLTCGCLQDLSGKLFAECTVIVIVSTRPLTSSTESKSSISSRRLATNSSSLGANNKPCSFHECETVAFHDRSHWHCVIWENKTRYSSMNLPLPVIENTGTA